MRRAGVKPDKVKDQSSKNTRMMKTLFHAVLLRLRKVVRISRCESKLNKHRIRPRMSIIIRRIKQATPSVWQSIKGFRPLCHPWNYTVVSISTKTALRGKSAISSKLANSLMNIRRSGHRQLKSLLSSGITLEVTSTSPWWSSKLSFARNSSLSQVVSLTLKAWSLRCKVIQSMRRDRCSRLVCKDQASTRASKGKEMEVDGLWVSKWPILWEILMSARKWESHLASLNSKIRRCLQLRAITRFAPMGLGARLIQRMEKIKRNARIYRGACSFTIKLLGTLRWHTSLIDPAMHISIFMLPIRLAEPIDKPWFHRALIWIQRQRKIPNTYSSAKISTLK